MNAKIYSDFIEPVFETPSDKGTWFGYYNYDPLNYDQTKLLCHRTINDARIVENGMTVEIGYFDIETGQWTQVGLSDSYNWPQASMSQWIPGKGNETKLIYNLSKNGRLISRIHDIATGDDRDIDWPIYGLTPDGKKSISIDLERSYYSLAYHYESVVNKRKNVRVLDDDGIFEIDLISNTKRCIISIDQIIKTDYHPEFCQCKHWLEHVMVSRTGKRFCFLHRFCQQNDNNKRTTRLFVADINGDNLQIIAGWNRYSWSHFGWDGDDAFSIYSYKKFSVDGLNKYRLLNPLFLVQKLTEFIARHYDNNFTRKIRKQILGQTSYYQYYRYEFPDGFTLKESYKKKEFAIDGHQNYTSDGQYMIADTYPDSEQYQNLIIYNKKKKACLVIARLFAGLHRKPGSCDLHPKLCKNNNYVMVDTAYDGRHHMIMFKINWSKVKSFFNNER